MDRIGQIGLTLLELLMTVAIAGVLISLAVPGFSSVRDSTARATTYSALTASFAYARGRAVQLRSRVVVCPSANGGTCDGGADWSRGWIVFPDPTDARQPASAAAVLQRFDALPSGVRAQGTAGRPLARFMPDGRAWGSNLTIRLCGRSGHLMGRVILSNSGRTRTDRASAGVAC